MESVNRYDPVMLLKKAYADIANINKNPTSKKFLLVKPDVVFSNRKTYVRNFIEISLILKRDQSDVKLYFENELKVVSSVDANDMLVLCGRYTQQGVETVLINYIKQNVLCPECRSSDTEIIKENRITFIKCNRCYTKKSLVV